jgi:hypothetical protein
MSLVLAFIVASTAIAPGIMGYLIDIDVDFQDQVLVCAVYMFLVTGFLLWRRKLI